MYQQPSPRAYARVRTARFAQHWWSCVSFLERFWANAVLNSGTVAPVGVLKEAVDATFVAVYGETMGAARLAIFLSAYGLREETLEIDGAQITLYVPDGDWWYQWHFTKISGEDFTAYSCEWDAYR